MDAPAGRGHTRAFVERVRRLLSGEPSQEPTEHPGSRSRDRCAGDRESPSCILARSKAALLATIAVVVARTRLPRGKPTRALEAWRRLGPAPRACRSARPGRLRPAAALHRGAAVREHERRQGAGVLLRRAHRGAAQLARRINELQVAARTSSFSFKGKDTDIGTIAHKLNVGAVLEGSVRRSAHTVRITAQLINAVTGFHLWSKTYDRDLGDVLKLQTEIATAVAEALKVTLLGDIAAKDRAGRDAQSGRLRCVSARGKGVWLDGTKPKTSQPRLPRTRKRSAWIRTMHSRSPADRSPFPMAPRRPRLQRRRAKALTRRRRMRARRSRSRRIWPRPTSPWRQFRKEPSTSRGRVKSTNAPSRSRRAMRKFCE